MHTGLASSWNISHRLATYAVAAQTEGDIQAGVAFAAKHNLRVVVKGTGHDWLGRSGSHPDYQGSLMIWTHNRKGMEWHDEGFVAQASQSPSPSTVTVTLTLTLTLISLQIAITLIGTMTALWPMQDCASTTSLPAVTLQSGIQFSDLYPVAEARGSFVNAGGCTSVGVGGCTLGGCFGSFSQLMGPSASNLLQAPPMHSH